MCEQKIQKFLQPSLFSCAKKIKNKSRKTSKLITQKLLLLIIVDFICKVLCDKHQSEGKVPVENNKIKI